MEHLLNPKAREIEISGIRKFANLVSQHENVISLTIGQPDFFTPHHVKAAAKKPLMTTLHHTLQMPVTWN